jgi:ribosomal-protein-alanine N-acetyltransferase
MKTFINDRIQDVKKGKTCFWGISELGNTKLIGTICLWNFNSTKTVAEVGYELHPDYHKKGIMSEALNTVLNFGFKDLQLKTIEAFTSQYNQPSRKLLQKFNFKLDVNRVDEGFPDNLIYLKHHA